MTDRARPETLDPIPEAYRKGQWQVTHYLEVEGGDWLAMGPLVEPPRDAIAIRYWNGWIYDFILRRNNLSPWRHVDD